MCVYSDAYLLVKGRMQITGEGDDAAERQVDEKNKRIIFKYCTLFTDCLSELNNTQSDHAKDLEVIMPLYNLIEYSDNYSKTSESLWRYYRVEPHNTLTDFTSFKSKTKITKNTPADGNTKNV